MHQDVVPEIKFHPKPPRDGAENIGKIDLSEQIGRVAL